MRRLAISALGEARKFYTYEVAGGFIRPKFSCRFNIVARSLPAACYNKHRVFL